MPIYYLHNGLIVQYNYVLFKDFIYKYTEYVGLNECRITNYCAWILYMQVYNTLLMPRYNIVGSNMIKVHVFNTNEMLQHKMQTLSMD